MKTTEITASSKPVSYQEPTHDEIALNAFLAWERDGRQPGREMQYWLEAEAQLRASRLKKAETSAQAAPQWPRPSRTVQVKRASNGASPKLTTGVQRNTAPKSPAIQKSSKRVA